MNITNEYVFPKTMPKAADKGYALSEEFKKKLSFEQYKQYINDAISKMPSSGKVQWDISDEGYKAMQNDPEYEKYVLDTIQDMLENSSPADAVKIVHIGKSKEEIFIEQLRKEQVQPDTSVFSDWWDKRMKLMYENIKRNVIASQKREREQNEFDKTMIFAERINAAERQEEFFKDGKITNSEIDKNSARRKAAVSAYQLSLIMENSEII